MSDQTTRSIPRLGAKPWIDKSASVVDCTLGAFTEIGARCDLVDCVFGDYSYVAAASEMIHTDVGRFTSIAAAVRINPGQHPMAHATQHHFVYRSAQYGLGDDDADFFVRRAEQRVTIGHDVWIGHGAIVMGGVTLGTGSVVGAGAVVTHDVAPYTIVAGTPARVLRPRVAARTAAALQRLAWWNWPHDALAAAMVDFRQLDAAAFCRKYGVEAAL